MILVVDFMGNAINSFQEPPASVLLRFCMDDRFYPRIFGMFSKIAVFFGSNLSVTQKLTVYFLRSTGFSLLYANFDNLLEIRCDKPQLLRTADQYFDLVFVLLFVH